MVTGSRLSVVSAYFTTYAYDALSSQLDQIDHLNFLFGEPRFIASLDPEKIDKKAFKIEDEGLELASRLQQKEVEGHDLLADCPQAELACKDALHQGDTILGVHQGELPALLPKPVDG